MGLFDQTIATCKQYLKPIKLVRQKINKLVDQAKFARDNDDIADEDVQFNEAPNVNKSRLRNKATMRKIKANI